MKKRFIPFVEIPVVEECNLNCQYCNSHAYLIDHNAYDLEQFKRDIDHLSQYVHFGVVTFLGGEPLMNNRLAEYIQYAKSKHIGEVYRILTNGILMEQVNPAVYDEIDVLEISKYASVKFTVHDFEERAERLAKKHHFRYYIKDIKYFNEIDTTTLSDEKAQQGYENCARIKNGCMIFNGYLYKCMRPKTTNQYLEAVHGITADEDMKVTDGVAITGDDFSDKLTAYLSERTMLTACKYCLMGLESTTTWFTNIRDWAYRKPFIIRLYYRNNLNYHAYKKLKKLLTYDEGAHSKDNNMITTHAHTVGHK